MEGESGTSAPGRNRTYGTFPPSRQVGRAFDLKRLRRTIGVVKNEEWKRLNRDERDAANALTLHVWRRVHATRHPAFDRDETFLTNGYVQRLLKAANATNTGEKAARKALATMQSETRADTCLHEPPSVRRVRPGLA